MCGPVQQLVLRVLHAGDQGEVPSPDQADLHQSRKGLENPGTDACIYHHMGVKRKIYFFDERENLASGDPYQSFP